MAKDSSASAGELIGERYRVVRELGRGGMGVVYEAVQEPLGRRVALKLLRPELAEDVSFAARFRREAELAASLGHPNIAQVTDFGVDQGRPFLVMDLLQGESLAELLAREGQLSESRAAFIASQMLDALCAAHARGVVHRDLKPDNVFLSRISDVADVVRLLDFGIAHSSEDETMRMTRTGQVLGTPAYMSPEQARGRAVDEASDLYAVGVCLYETTSGRLPFDTSNYHELLFSIVGEEPTPLATLRPDLSPEFCAVVTCAMAKDKSERYPDATAMREALLPLFKAGAPQSSVPSAPSTQGRPHTPVAYAPTVTPEPERTPVAYAPTLTPATEPPAPLAPQAALAQATVDPVTRRPSASGPGWRTLGWMVSGLLVAAVAALLGRLSGPDAATPPTASAPAAVVSDASQAAPPVASQALAAIIADAASAQPESPDSGAVVRTPAAEVPAAAIVETHAPTATPTRRRHPRRPRTRRMDCNGYPRELPIVRRGDIAQLQSFAGNHVVELQSLKRQTRARVDEIAACYRGHPMRQGRWWQLTLDAEGVVRDVGPRGYCDVDPPVTACMRQLWTGYHFQDFMGRPGSVRIGVSLRGH